MVRSVPSARRPSRTAKRMPTSTAISRCSAKPTSTCSPGITRVSAATSRVAVTSVDVVEPNLEAVFLHLTGKALRD